MKLLTIDWKGLAKQCLLALKDVLIGAVGAGLIVFGAGCSSLATTPRGQTTEIIAVGIPAVAWISHTSQDADHRAGDTNSVVQLNANDVELSAVKGKE